MFLSNNDFKMLGTNYPAIQYNVPEV